MLKSLISKLVGISSVVVITGSLAAGPANAAVLHPIGNYLNPCHVTGPRISTITSEAGFGFGDLAIRGTCFPAGVPVDVVFATYGPGLYWKSDAHVVAASDGTFTTPMVWRPPTTFQLTEYVYAAVPISTPPPPPFPAYNDESNTLTFQVGGTINLH